MFLFMLINSLRSPRHLQASSNSQNANMGLEWVGVGLGTASFRSCRMKWAALIPPSNRSQRVLNCGLASEYSAASTQLKNPTDPPN